MVKLSGLRGFRCRIRCNGRVLEEYEDDETQDTETTATRYVEAITGAEFAIKISTLRNFGWKTTAFTAEVYIDGIHASTNTIKRSTRLKTRYDTIVKTITHFHEGRTFTQTFKFAELELVPNDSAMDPEGTTADDLEELGTISIYFHRIKITGRSKLRSLAGLIEEEGKATTKKVTEKSLKGRAFSHSTSFGPSKPAADQESGGSIYTTDIDPEEEPGAQITFKYRSRSALRSLLIVPRSPTPVPLEERTIESLNIEELRGLARRNQARPTARLLAKVKRERNDESEAGDDSANDVSIVETRPAKARKTKTVDLTADED